jgi:hypothetical protein
VNISALANEPWTFSRPDGAAKAIAMKEHANRGLTFIDYSNVRAARFWAFPGTMDHITPSRGSGVESEVEQIGI